MIKGEINFLPDGTILITNDIPADKLLIGTYQYDFDYKNWYCIYESDEFQIDFKYVHLDDVPNEFKTKLLLMKD